MKRSLWGRGKKKKRKEKKPVFLTFSPKISNLNAMEKKNKEVPKLQELFS